MSCIVDPAPTAADSAICPCGTPLFPHVPCNAPGLAAIDFRIGDYAAFRHRLLQQLPGEVELPAWRPGAEGDLAVQIVEWAAYLGDILTFYNARIANESFLRTAMLPESVKALVGMLGYRPRPALGSRGWLAGLLATGARPPVALPGGVQFQSKPAPGAKPQIFELDTASTLQTPDVIATAAVPAATPISTDGKTLWLAGKVSGIKAGEYLLLIPRTALIGTAPSTFAWLAVAGTAAATDPLGAAVTAVSFTVAGGVLPGSASAGGYTLLRASRSMPLWGFPTTAKLIDTSGSNAVVALAAVARDLVPNSLVLAESGSALAPALVATYAEKVWYANCQGGTDPTVAPTAANTPAIAMPIAKITVSGLDGSWIGKTGATFRWGWSAVGALVPMVTSASRALEAGGRIAPTGSASLPPAGGQALIEDANGNGADVVLTGADAADTAGVTFANGFAMPSGGFAAPIDVLPNRLPVSRGKTVPREVLGSGNPAISGQDFTLKNAPITYFGDTLSVSGDGFSSTVAVRVDGILWAEKQSFYGQTSDAQIFVLREDDAGNTHVTFGDGVNGARLPTGVDNMIASYRYGAGAAAPAAGSLTVVLTPQPGLKGVRNPVPPTGGADPDAPAKLRSLAPQSVLAFDRAVSLDDYAVIARTAGGVVQASAEVAFDALAQRPMVTVWVAGDAGAGDAAAAKLAGFAMPNQRWIIKVAQAETIRLSLTFVYDARYDPTVVSAALSAALLDPDEGLFGANVVAIGQSLYDSQIEAACLAVAGVTAIRSLSLSSGLQGLYFARWRRRSLIPLFRYRKAGCAGHRHDPGAGKYYVLPDDGAHLTLTPEAAA